MFEGSHSGHPTVIKSHQPTKHVFKKQTTFIPFKSVFSDLLSFLHPLSYFKVCVGSKARGLQVLHKTYREPKRTLHRHGDRWEVAKFKEAIGHFFLERLWLYISSKARGMSYSFVYISHG